ncbi:MAG: regulatory protein RecX [Legionellales bacterium]|nr:regulatory protein RecX [Legionellales bacterium]
MKTDATNCAISLLTRREHGAVELVRKLEIKGYPLEEAKDALKTCLRLGFQSDERFVGQLCRARIRQGYGPIRIREELLHLKVDVVLITTALELESDHWLERAREIRAKKYKTSSESSFKALQKQKQFLYYRGFSAETIAQVFTMRDES